jgi:predicted ATPase
MLRGWALTEQGKEEEGLTKIQQGLSAQRVTGEELERPYWLALLTEAYGKVGRAEEGLSALAEALGQVDKTGARLHEAELYRLKGDLLLTQEGKRQKAKGKSQKSERPSPNSQLPEPLSEAEAYFLMAIEISQKQQAKSLELRATMSLARLWQRQGKRCEAHNMLSKIYNWFTEGFDTKDLQKAKALLEELGH